MRWNAVERIDPRFKFRKHLKEHSNNVCMDGEEYADKEKVKRACEIFIPFKLISIKRLPDRSFLMQNTL